MRKGHSTITISGIKITQCLRVPTKFYSADLVFFVLRLGGPRHSMSQGCGDFYCNFSSEVSLKMASLKSFIYQICYIITVIHKSNCEFIMTNNLTFYCEFSVTDKKVLLRERNRHTAHRVASTRYAVPVGGTFLSRSQVRMGGVPPFPDLGGGTHFPGRE